jgi:hypothetical protein
MITHQRLKELFSYADGELIRKGKTAGSLNKRGYKIISVDYVMYKAHRLVFLTMQTATNRTIELKIYALLITAKTE